MRSTRTLIAPFVALALLAASCTSSNGSTASTASAPSIEERGGTYRVTIDPAGFVDVIDNPYFPLIPGSKWRLEGETDEGKEVDAYICGRKGEAYFKFRQRPIVQAWTGFSDQPTYDVARDIGPW